MKELANSSVSRNQLWDFLLGLFLLVTEMESKRFRAEAEILNAVQETETMEGPFLILSKLDPIKAMKLYLNQDYGVNEETLKRLYWEMEDQVFNQDTKAQISDDAYSLAVGLLTLLNISAKEISEIFRTNETK